ncbi:MAG: hypothetical protein ACOCWL_01595, partial [Thermoguttaceae bacterium]
YTRMARVREGRPIDGGFWLDSYRPAATSGVRASVDVLIRAIDRKGDLDPAAEVPMVVELLSVEAREP